MIKTHTAEQVAPFVAFAALLGLSLAGLGAQAPPAISPLAAGSPGLEEPIRQIRAGQAAQTAALLEKRADRDSFVITVVRAFAHREAGDRARAVALIRALTANADARIELQAYRLLAEIGEEPPAAARPKVLGALVEFGSPGEPLVIAGYGDGSARVFFRDGRAGQETGENVSGSARALVTALGRKRDQLRPERSRELPGPGLVRFVLLTPGGVFDRTLTAAELKQTRHPLAESLGAARRLQAAAGTAR